NANVRTPPAAPSIPDPPLAAQRSVTGPPPPRHRGGLGKYCLHLAAGDWAAEQDQIGVERQRAPHLRGAVGQRRTCKHALVQLAPERLDRGALGDLVPGGP